MGEFAKQLLESERESEASRLSTIRSAAATQQARANAALASGDQAEYEKQSALAKNSQEAYDAGKSKISDIDKQINDLTPPSITNTPATETATAKKYEDPTRVPDPATNDPSAAPTIDQTKSNVLSAITGSDDKKASRLPPNIPPGADAKNQTPASAEWAGAKDLRVFLRVPTSYLIGPAAGPIGDPLLKDIGGILFPYTPQISYESAASYSAVNPVHSNYTQQFYKNSSVGNINISGKFTVQNEKEGAIYCSIIHLLRSLTKMRWGSDANAGAPPPVCRLEAFGDFMLRNVPVVVTSFKFDLPDNVDYIQVPMFKTTLVPTISTITLGLAIMYSRREMQDYSVDAWLNNKLKGQGYL
jgi:hypothetical protein